MPSKDSRERRYAMGTLNGVLVREIPSHPGIQGRHCHKTVVSKRQKEQTRSHIRPLSRRLPSLSLLYASLAIKDIAHRRHRPRPARGVYDEQSKRGDVDEVMQHIHIRHAVDGGVHGDDEEEGGHGVAEAVGDAGDHLAARERLDEEDERHDGEDVVVGGEGREPLHDDVVGPDNEDGEVDGGDGPEHEGED
ncbi:hypothetical protein V499_09738 [Pseudogymnoascus sp. VKM F-103]|nr:hypothetical protein V499_09738 [Pseudogymnoascus sp. VKM F-103]